jgi:hypothetical protein
MDNSMRELMPLTAAALIEESWFDATQALAAQRGWEFARASTGYRVSCAGVTRHYLDLRDAADFVRSLPGVNHA